MVFFFNDTATTEIYTLSLHDALPIYQLSVRCHVGGADCAISLGHAQRPCGHAPTDRKSTRLNSSHGDMPHAVFCLADNQAGHGSHPALPTPTPVPAAVTSIGDYPALT